MRRRTHRLRPRRFNAGAFFVSRVGGPGVRRLPVCLLRRSLVGDSVTLVSPARGLSETEFKEKYATWQEASARISKEMSAADATQRGKAQQEFQKLYQKRSEFMNEDATGFVWLYLQK